DIEKRDAFALEAFDRQPARPQRAAQLGGRIAQEDGHCLISLVTGLDWSRKRPPVQPPQIAENRPAFPPARTIKSPSGQNLLTISSARLGAIPSPTPWAPWTRSLPGRTVSL